jgi:ectoine hydroxylase-related dioxygenase (phytanoyl-CoA dioxygenase family)
MHALPALHVPYEVPTTCVAEFEAKGHTMLPGLASPDEVAAYRPAIETTTARLNREKRPIEERDTYGRAFLQTINLWRANEAVKRFVFSQRFARAAAEILGVDGVRLYHDQSLFKESGGGRTPWHQDQVYWPLDTDRTVTLWMPLVDVPRDVGSMTFASGSHHAGDLGGGDISDRSDAELSALLDELGLIPETHGALRAGDATFHAGWTLHSAAPNPSGATRPVMTVIYFADGARVTEPSSQFQQFDLAMWLDGCAPGGRAAGPLNPLLWSRYQVSSAGSSRRKFRRPQ